MTKFAEKFQFMGNMLQKLDTDYTAHKKEHGALIKKFNGERQLVVKLKQQLNMKHEQLQSIKH